MKNIYILWDGFFGHPEVLVCLVISLYAGINYEIYRYYIYIILKKLNLMLINIVTKLYIWENQQETFFKGSSETTRDNIILKSSNIYNNTKNKSLNKPGDSRDNQHSAGYKNISIHVPSKRKPLNDDQLGYYLAGLIDGDGNFSKQKGNLTIAYDLKDKSAAYWLKSQIGYGTVSPIKNKNCIKYVVSHSDGLLRILELINGKLKTHNKYMQVINYLLCNNNLVKNKFYNKYNNFIKGNLNDFNNHWLAGFIDSDGSLQIKIIKPKSDIKYKSEIRLRLQIAQKDKEILNYIKLFICKSDDINNIDSLKGCYIGTRIHNNSITYYLEVTSFNTIKNVIMYLDTYQLISYKYLNFLYFRKAYLIVQNKEHLCLEGINKIKILKEKMKYIYNTSTDEKE